MTGEGGEETEKRNEIELGKPSSVELLSRDNITEFLSQNDESFIMFYSPCK